MDSYIECLCCSGNKWEAFKRSLKYSFIIFGVLFIIATAIGSPIVFIISIIKITSKDYKIPYDAPYQLAAYLSGFVVLGEFLLLFMCIFVILRECVLYNIRVKKMRTQPQSNSSSEELPVEPPVEPIAIVVSDPT